MRYDKLIIAQILAQPPDFGKSPMMHSTDARNSSSCQYLAQNWVIQNRVSAPGQATFTLQLAQTVASLSSSNCLYAHGLVSGTTIREHSFGSYGGSSLTLGTGLLATPAPAATVAATPVPTPAAVTVAATPAATIAAARAATVAATPAPTAAATPAPTTAATAGMGVAKCFVPQIRH